jgi:hypothetical protein
MFKQILTLLRGRAYDAEQEFLDRNAMPLLAQQIRDASAAIQAARRAVAIAIAQNEQEVEQHRAALARIADLETRAIAALQKGNETLAREAAEAIGWLEAECAASERAQARFKASIERMKSVVRASEARLRELNRGERRPVPPSRPRSSTARPRHRASPPSRKLRKRCCGFAPVSRRSTPPLLHSAKWMPEAIRLKSSRSSPRPDAARRWRPTPTAFSPACARE